MANRRAAVIKDNDAINEVELLHSLSWHNEQLSSTIFAFADRHVCAVSPPVRTQPRLVMTVVALTVKIINKNK